jgi:dienelactone hydrolase
VLGRIAAAVDQAASAVALARSKRSRARSRAESLGPAERRDALGRIAALYAGTPLDDPEAFFPRPAAPEVETRRVRAFGPRGEVLDASWESAYDPFVGAVADRYLGHRDNRRAHARLFLHTDRPRPAAILVHGYMGGSFAFEERAWPLRWLFDLGLDLALPVLPFHALRAGRKRPQFPNSDPRVTVEGFRQAVMDLRALVRFFEARGSSATGVMGMSLGGYTTALVATVEPRLAFAVPFIPLASIADFARDGNRLVGTETERAEQHRLLDEAHRVVSPFARPVRVPHAGRLVAAGRADRITPVAHAERIARHFDVPLTLFPGGHLLQVGRAEAFRAVGRMLGTLGLLEPR